MPAYTMTDLENRVYAALDNNSALYPQAEVDLELNCTIQWVNLYLALVQTASDLISVAGHYLYTIPAGMLFPTRVQFEGRALQKESLRVISTRDRSWLTQTTATGRPVRHWVPIDLQTFAIHPADAIGGRDIQVTGVADPANLIPAQPLIKDDQTVEIICDMTTANLQLKEAGAIFAKSSLAYQRAVRFLKARSRWEALRFPPYFVRTESTEVKEEVGATV